MQKYNKSLAKDKLELLKSKPLLEITNEKGVLYLAFGELVENVNSSDTSGKVPEYVLKIATQFRISLRQEILVGKQDMFWPSYALSHSEGYNPNAFDCYSDETKFDQQIERFFSSDVISDYIVRDVEVGELGDFTITFENKAKLEVNSSSFGVIASEENYELWRLFEPNNIESDFIITPLGIAETESEIRGEIDD